MSDYIPNEYKNKAEEIMREMYKLGYHDGINDGKIKMEEAYNNGLYDAWEAARKIVYPIEYGGLTPGQLSKIFGTAPTYDILKRFSATEAIENIKEYESHLPDKDVGEIKVGDEVILSGQIGVVSEEPYKIGQNQQLFARVWFAVGSSSTINVENLKKTGKHYPAIAEVLEQMKGDSNED